MEPDAAELAHWLTTVFPHLTWRGEAVRIGAFHLVALTDHYAARVLVGDQRDQRAAREAQILWTLHRVHIGVAMPRLCSDVFSSPGRVGFLTTRVPGVHDNDLNWTQLRASYLAVLDGLAAVPTHGLHLPEPRAWCGGREFARLVADDLCPRLPSEVAATARLLVDELEALPAPATTTLVHGDFGPHNVLWRDDEALSLIDFDHCCVGDPALDIAPLVGRYGSTAVSSDVDEALLTRAMVHRATLSLQVAVAAHLNGFESLRDHALGTVVRRHAEGTLHDPDGARP